MNNLFQELNQELNKDQILAVKHKEGPLLVLAGAGSGKTRIVTYRIAYLITQDVLPEKILAVTFTNKAAEEMRKRVNSLQSQAATHRPLIATFHSLAAKILRESIHHLGYKNDFVIYDTEDTNKVLRGCFQRLGLQKEASLLKQCRSLISHKKNQSLEEDPDKMPLELQSSFEELYQMYQTVLKESNAVDFDDLLFLVVRLFKEHPDVLAYYQNCWDYLLIDEYQDTNQTQYLLVQQLIEKTHNIFVVGDPDQSIYSWRGANIHNILNFEKDFPNAKVVRLEQNYRSRKIILDASNQLIQNNRFRYEKNLWSDKVGGEKIALFIGNSDRDEALFVVEEIQKLQTQKKCSLKECVIFYRTNFQSRIFEDILLRQKIPYQIIGGLSFYERKEVKDLLAFLTIIASDSDFIAFSRSLSLLKGGIGDLTLEKMRRRASEEGFSIVKMALQALDGNSDFKITEKQKKGLTHYLTLIAELRVAAKTLSLKELVVATLQKTDYIELLKEDRESFEERKSNIEELITKAYEWENFTNSSTLQLFLEELKLKNAVDDLGETREHLNLMTLHNGKGLEFNTVFLVGMEEDLFPHANARLNSKAVEEERRLCYVGMTRAKERLYLTAAKERFLWGNHRTMRPSRFLREIPKEYMEIWGNSKVVYERAKH